MYNKPIRNELLIKENYIVKKYIGYGKKERFINEKNILIKLNNEKIPSPLILNENRENNEITLDKIDGFKSFTLCEWNSSMYYDLGAFLGEIHALNINDLVIKNYVLPIKNTSLRGWIKLFKTHEKLITSKKLRNYNRLRRKIENENINAANLELRLIHGDLNTRNIGWSHKKIVLVDYEDANIGFPEKDIADVILRFLIKDDKFDRRNFDSFLKGYRNIQKLNINILIQSIYNRVSDCRWIFESLLFNQKERLKFIEKDSKKMAYLIENNNFKSTISSMLLYHKNQQSLS